VYDALGNRVEAVQGSGADAVVTGYTADGLNQYEAITHARQVELTGQAAPGAVVGVEADGIALTVDTAEGSGEPGSWRAVAALGSAEAAWLAVRVTATAPGQAAVVHESHVHAPPAVEAPVYDLDGNLTQDARWTYTWDAENRLVSAEERGVDIVVRPAGAPPRLKLTFAYDHRHRRIAKRVHEWSAVTGSFSNLVKELRYLYHGWNMIAELDHTFSSGAGLEGSRLVRSHVWGPDVAGQEGGPMEGAGGVGGLLATWHQGSVYYPCLDGNGNVGGHYAASGPQAGKLVARYDYDAFGNRITNTGPEVELCPFGFSTKYRDEETGMLYYGFRYYQPEMGRWLSRDPIGITGGLNLYGMVGNDPVNHTDKLGLLRIASREFPGECGEYAVTFLFQLSQPAASAGYLVQEINKTVEVTDCATGKTTKETSHFWESWQVQRGSQVPDGRGNHGNDTSGRGNQGCTKGRVVSHGTLKFVPYSTTGLLGGGYPTPYRQDGSWGPGNGSTIPGTDVINPSRPGHPDSGVLPSTRDEPPWWDQPSNENGWRKVEAEWDCCKQGPYRPGGVQATKLKVTHS
jgi:RHS repeat-associated protein